VDARAGRRAGGSLTLDAEARLAALEEVCAAIAHPARRQILLTVHLRGAMAAGDIASRFAHAWPTTTRHLRVLVDAGLLVQTRHGRSRVYAVCHDRLGVVRDWLGWFDPAAARPG
jgi:DNA-binding transcriptional ArsR family regulator